MGIIGPITSFVIGVVCLLITIAVGWTPPNFPQRPLPAVLLWLGLINIGLAIFNMIPGFPLDGGRVLRGIIWWVTGNAKRATTIAARVGQVIAFFLILYGLMQFFRGAGFNGLWMAFIGWFLLSASRESYAQMVISEGLRGLRVGDVMSRDFPVVDAYANLQTFAEENLTRTGRRFWVVTRNGEPEGIITPNEISAVPRNRWPYTTVADVMRPLDATRTVNPNTPVTEALEVMARQDLNQLPVVNERGLAGLISRAHILQLIQTRAELHL
jgi:CBS domain-containing protein